MRDATFSELRNRARHYFDLVESGETVRVLRNGKPIAEIHPIAPEVPSWKRRSVRPLVIPGRAISQVILDQRGE